VRIGDIVPDFRLSVIFATIVITAVNYSLHEAMINKLLLKGTVMMPVIRLHLHFGTMTELLRRVVAEIEKLPEEEQDAIATRLLAELEDEQVWKARFESTTNEQWDRLAEMVRLEIIAGDTTPLDDVFPPKQ
jgi:hypothetical protein